ncbi:MAG: hypothetical protein GXO64_04465 [Candidatus Micrarchaeota archaeon]|nr:hypothetical protein [Candidatus Micrarchaeota archaeon]
MSILYWASFLFFSWTFGNIAVKSLRKKIHFATRYILSLGVGFIILFCASAMGNVFKFVSGGIFDLFKANLIINGIIATAIFSFAFYLLAAGTRRKEPSEIIKELNKKIQVMKDALSRNNIKTISDDDAKKRAIKLVDGYSAKNVVMRDDKWDVYMEDENGKKADVLIDPYDGSYEIIKDESHLPLKRIIGALLIIGIVLFSFFNFTGFYQDDLSSIAESLGIPESEFKNIIKPKNLPEGCTSAMSIAVKYGMKINELEKIDDEQMRLSLEEKIGERIIGLFIAPYNGMNYTMVVTLPHDFDMQSASEDDITKNTNICVALGDTLCDCLK